MIKSFKHHGLRDFHGTGNGRRIPEELHQRADQILTVLDTATSVAGVRHLLRRRFHAHKRLKNTWCLTVNNKWEITFIWDNNGPAEVDLKRPR